MKIISGEFVFDYIVPMSPLFLMIALTFLPIPKEFRGPLMFTSIPVLFMIMWVQEVAIRDKVNKYPHLFMIVLPEKKIYHIYIASGKSKKISFNVFSTIFNLAFPTQIEEAEGEIKQIKLNHIGKFTDRIHFDPTKRMARYFGQWVDHPQTDVIVVRRDKTAGRLTIKDGCFIPTYVLEFGSKDRLSNKGSLLLSKLDKYPDCARNCEKIRELNHELVEYKSQAALFHEDSASYGEIIDQQEATTEGLRKAKTGGVDYGIELLTALYRACGTIDKTIKQMRGSRFKLEPWMIIPVVAIAGFLFITLNPSFGKTASVYFSSPLNQAFIIVLIVAVGAMGYWVTTKRRPF